MITLERMTQLTTLYTQPHRKYHNINHINDCLAELENIPHSGVNFNDRTLVGLDCAIIEDAIWYHDAIYNPYSKLNERRSFDLIPDSANPSYDGAVREAVLATANHLYDQSVLAITTQIMLDIDLAGFGKERHVFARNGMNIRHEYYNTKLVDFLKGRKNFYDALVKRPTLYYTDYFHHKYHEKSRENIRWEIDLLNRAYAKVDTSIWSEGMMEALEL